MCSKKDHLLNDKFQVFNQIITEGGEQELRNQPYGLGNEGSKRWKKQLQKGPGSYVTSKKPPEV